MKKELSRELKHDIEELSSVGEELVERFRLRLKPLFGLKCDWTSILKDVKETTLSVLVVEFIALRCIDTLLSEYSYTAAENIDQFRKSQLVTLRLLNGCTQCIRMFRRAGIKNYRELIEVIDKNLIPFVAEKSEFWMPRTVLLKVIEEIECDPKALEETKNDIISMLLQFQIIIGIFSKWAIITELELKKAVREKKPDLSAAYEKYIRPLREALPAVHDFYPRFEIKK